MHFPKLKLFNIFNNFLAVWRQQRIPETNILKKHLQKYIAQSPISHL